MAQRCRTRYDPDADVLRWGERCPIEPGWLCAL